MDEQFPCLRCGACCRATASFPDEIMARAGLRRGPHGWCEHLGADNTCAIYDDRPDLCRISAVHAAWGMPKYAGWRFSAMGCDALMKREGDGLAGFMSRRVALIMPHAGDQPRV